MQTNRKQKQCNASLLEQSAEAPMHGITEVPKR